jgi:hypothetical protein
VRNLTTAPAFVWSDCPKWNGVMCDSFSGETVCADCWAAWRLVTNWAALKAAGKGKMTEHPITMSAESIGWEQVEGRE